MFNYKYFISERITIIKLNNIYLRININENLNKDPKYNLYYNIFKNLIKHHRNLFLDFLNIICELEEN